MAFCTASNWRGRSMNLSRRTLLGGGGLFCATAFASYRQAFANDGAEYFYDPLGRLIRVELSDGTIVVYDYDAAGNRTRVVHGDDVPFNQTLQITGTGPVNLRTLADQAGYLGVTNATILFQVASGVTITGPAGAPHGGVGIDTGTWPSASKSISLALEISGRIYGGGGRGASSGLEPLTAGTGGDAIFCQENIAITVKPTGQVRAGGGGGGYGGGWEYSFENAEDEWETQFLPGGGGGGGFANGPGAGGGANGSASAGGAGGGGGSAGGGRVRGAGGAGGGAAATGAAGAVGTGSAGCNGANTQCWNGPTAPIGGGAPGYAVRKNGKTVSVTVESGGVVSGATS
jgi:YD repeat-containing protein